MAANNNATCSICGSEYHLCLSCKDKMKLHPYKIHCCSADCFKVFQVVRGFSTNVYTKDEFKSKLKNIDLSNLENYREHIKALIKDVLKEESVEVNKNVDILDIKEDSSVTDKTDEENVINVIIEDVENHEKVEKAESVSKMYSRKRNFRVEE